LRPCELGHDRIDLPKADIEGSEYEILDPHELAEIGVRVVCFELHATVSPGEALAFVERFRREGFRPVNRTLPNYTLVRE
jgi:hypothetical protein